MSVARGGSKKAVFDTGPFRGRVMKKNSVCRVNDKEKDETKTWPTGTKQMRYKERRGRGRRQVADAAKVRVSKWNLSCKIYPTIIGHEHKGSIRNGEQPRPRRSAVQRFPAGQVRACVYVIQIPLARYHVTVLKGPSDGGN